MTRNRAQIQFDFAVGVSIFVMTLIVAFTFVPGLFGGAGEVRAEGDQVVADRVAAWLAEDGFDEPDRPGHAAPVCVVALFDSGTAACGFDDGDGSLGTDEFDYGDTRNVQVKITNETNLVCWTGSEFDSGSDATTCSDSSHRKLSGTGVPPGNTEVSVASRPVSIGGYQATISVRVW